MIYCNDIYLYTNILIKPYRIKNPEKHQKNNGESTKKVPQKYQNSTEYVIHEWIFRVCSFIHT